MTLPEYLDRPSPVSYLRGALARGGRTRSAPEQAATGVSKVVMLAYYFPPLAGIASDRASALVGVLPALGWEPVVITARNGFYHRAPEPPPGCELIRTPSLELSRIVRAAYSRSARTADPESASTTVSAVPTGPLGNWLREVVRELVYVPDGQAGWIPFAAAAARQALSQAGPRSVLWSTSVPYSAHLAAMRAARRSGSRWVAEFRDPWSTAHPANLPRRSVRRRLDLALERRILRTADHVIVTSDTTRRDLLIAHTTIDPDRVTVVTNGFVPMPTRPVPDPSSPLAILYAGTVAPGEDVTPVLTALARVDADHPGAVRLRVLGDPAPWREAASPSARPWLELTGVVSPSLAREAMTGSSALLLVQRHPAYRSILRGKMFEYIGARRPIIALCPEDIEAARLLDRYADARIVSGDAVEGTDSELRRLLREHQRGEIQEPRVPLDLIGPLRREVQAGKLAEIFEQTVVGPALN